MVVDRVILISAWVAATLLVVLCTPRHKIREATIVYLFKQTLTWLFGLLIVELRLIEYPVREFAHATRSSFAFEYYIYPVTCVVFVLRFPEKKTIFHKMGWYFIWPTWITICEVLIERYTDLIRYLHWTWYWTWISLLVTFWMSRVYYKWFTSKPVPSRTEKSPDA